MQRTTKIDGGRQAKPDSEGPLGGKPVAGELALIERIRRRAMSGSRSRDVRLGIGDDCAIVRPRAGEEIVVTTDFSLEGRHFRRDWHAPESIGHRALARGLSDLAAMGARPVAAFLSLALPRSAAADAGWIDGFLDGWLRLSDRAGVPLAGGDTSEAPGEQVLIDVVLLGAAPAGRALRRSGARAGDRIFVTGALGGAGMELKRLQAARNAAFADDGSPAPDQRGRQWGEADPRATGDGMQPHLFPEPRLAAGQALLQRGLATAAMDLSDGLSTDLRHLCEASKVRATVEASRIPLHPLLAGAPPAAALELALNGGEDYELLFTVAAEAKVPRRLGGVRLTEIGKIERLDDSGSREPLVALIAAEGETVGLVPGGWEHLR